MEIIKKEFYSKLQGCRQRKIIKHTNSNGSNANAEIKSITLYGC